MPTNTLAEITAENGASRRTSIGTVELLLGFSCAAILGAQSWLLWRINVNWDEFYFLTHVHSLLRGELTRTFQMSYTHLFTWLPAVGDEMTQITAARIVMFALFAISAVLLVKLASRWASTGAALVALLCFLASSPVLRHGSSFRADSILLPLLLAVAVIVTRSHTSKRADHVAGVLFGAALAVSIKASLFAPMLVAMAIARQMPGTVSAQLGLRSLIARWVLPAITALGVFVVVLVLHSLSLTAPPTDAPAAYAEAVVRKTLLDVPLFARLDYLRSTVRADVATWILLAFGSMAALARRRWEVAACTLALLPIVVYRNAFPYFYVVMLAPASVLAAVAVDELRTLARRQAQARIEWVTPALAGMLLVQAFVHVAVLKADDQWQQRQTIAAVHQVFPHPVPYIDHSGMIASFRKVNFFMSSWGMDNYRASGKGFMRQALRDYRPPLLLANRGEIDPWSPAFQSLLAEDRELIERFYLRYWGPIWVAGVHTEVPSTGSTTVNLPFPGRYRLVSNAPVEIDGVMRRNGEVIEFSNEHCRLAMSDGLASESTRIMLITAEAHSPPEEPATFASIYMPL